MKINNFVIGLGFLVASALLAQGPIYDRVRVNLPYPVTVAGKVLQPGDYVIQQHEDIGGGSLTLTFFGKDGTKLETTAVAVPIQDRRTPEETKLVIDHVGKDYVLNRIWVQGKDFGYEFPVPPSFKMRQLERNAPASVVAQYTPPAPAPPPPTVAKNETIVEERREQAEAAPPPPPPAPAPAPQAPPPAPAPAMPRTASNWLNLAIAGGLLMSSGFALRRGKA